MFCGDLLRKHRIRTSAPCRIDVGGTWDLKAFALPYEHIKPTTVNFAIALRTEVELHPFENGLLRVRDEHTDETFPYDKMPFDTHFGLVFAILSHFQLHGLELKLVFDAPPKSGLGGSGTLAVGVIAALDKGRNMLGLDRSLVKSQIVHIAHDIEDGLRFSYTGLQDQCAAVYGGVNKWKWRYTHWTKFQRFPLMCGDSSNELSSRLVLAYTGKSHASADVNSKQVASFLSGKTRKEWFRINDIAKEFAEVIVNLDWKRMAELVQEENDIRVSLVPQRITPIGEDLQAIARQVGGGFGIAGAGNGGCVFAICPEPEQAEKLRCQWQEALSVIPDGKVLDVEIDNLGVTVDLVEWS